VSHPTAPALLGLPGQDQMAQLPVQPQQLGVHHPLRPPPRATARQRPLTSAPPAAARGPRAGPRPGGPAGSPPPPDVLANHPPQLRVLGQQRPDARPRPLEPRRGTAGLQGRGEQVQTLGVSQPAALHSAVGAKTGSPWCGSSTTGSLVIAGLGASAAPTLGAEARVATGRLDVRWGTWTTAASSRTAIGLTGAPRSCWKLQRAPPAAGPVETAGQSGLRRMGRTYRGARDHPR
jgi:hypothetical protein